MPSERFLKLDEEKKDRIIEAAREELAAHPMEDVSINRIVKKAGISRGSFYTYFEDKDDLRSFLISDKKKREYDIFKEELRRRGFDNKEVLSIAVKYVMNEMERLRSLGIGPETMAKPTFPFIGDIDQIYSEEDEEFAEWLWTNIGKDGLNLESFETFKTLIVLYRVLLTMTAFRIYLSPEAKDEVTRSFEDMVRIIKEGIIKR